MNIEEVVEESKTVDNSISNERNNEISDNEEINIEEKQNKFLESTLGKVINTGVDIALRAILPNMIEDEIIRHKKCNNNRRI